MNAHRNSWVDIVPDKNDEKPYEKMDRKILHCKKRLAIFLSPDGMSLTTLSLARNNLIIPDQGEFGWWHSGWGRENR